MAGCTYAVFDPKDFLLGFVVTEVIALLSKMTKEDMHMVKKAAVSSGENLWSCVKSSTRRLSAFWEAHLPFKAKPADELVQFKRKGNESATELQH